MPVGFFCKDDWEKQALHDQILTSLWSAHELAGELYEILEAEEQRADPNNIEEMKADLSKAEEMDLLIEEVHTQVAAFRFHFRELMINPHKLLEYLHFRDELKQERGWG